MSQKTISRSGTSDSTKLTKVRTVPDEEEIATKITFRPENWTTSPTDGERIEIWPGQKCGCQDATHKDHHDILSFTERLNKITPDLLANHRQYDKVIALLIYWQESDVEELQDYAAELEEAFKAYGFETRPHVLMNRDTTKGEVRREFSRALGGAVNDISSNRDTNLLIIYYAGHGTVLTETNCRGWEPYDPGTSADVYINWTTYQQMMREQCEADVLFLFECCYAGSMVNADGHTPWQKCCEVIGASGIVERVPVQDDGSKSFTRALAEQLQELQHSDGFTVADLQARLLRITREKLPSTPTFFSCTHPSYNCHISLKSAPSEDGSNGPGDLTEKPEIGLGSNDPQMLIAVRFTGSPKTLIDEQYHRWIKGRPHSISALRFIPMVNVVRWHATFESNSVLALISLPLTIWNLMPKDAAMTPVGIIKSDNLLRPSPSEQLKENMRTDVSTMLGQWDLCLLVINIGVISSGVLGWSLTSSPKSMTDALTNECFWTRTSTVAAIGGTFIAGLARGFYVWRRKIWQQLTQRTTGSSAGRHSGETTTEGKYEMGPSTAIGNDAWTLVKAMINVRATLGGLVFPLMPATPDGETYPTPVNVGTLAAHTFLLLSQFVIIASAVFLLVHSFTTVILLFSAILANKLFCRVIFGGPSKNTFKAGLKYENEKQNEVWIYINSIGTSTRWMDNDLARLARTFRRPVTGFYVPTNGFLFDLSLYFFRRNFSYSSRTSDAMYLAIVSALHDPSINKVVILAHGSGAMEVSIVLDQLYARVSPEKFQHLEIYTFGNMAVTFNNPHYSGRFAIQHMEHFINSEDSMAKFAGPHLLRPENYLAVKTKDIDNKRGFSSGAILSRQGSGHLLIQHYLSILFPLEEGSWESFVASEAYTERYKLITPDQSHSSQLTKYLNGRVPGDDDPDRALDMRP